MVSDEVYENFLSLKDSLDPYQGLADFFGFDKSSLVYWIFRQDRDLFYKEFTIKKKSGGERLIKAPLKQLKLMQKKLHPLLDKAYKRKKAAHGFVSGKSPATNAYVHIGKRHILNIDLVNFFPSIGFKRVYGVFSNYPFNFPKTLAGTLANICCYQGSLPQGSPSSPIISNFICRKLDNELTRLAIKYNCFYTRYGDDITFSSNLKKIPEQIATKIEGYGASLGRELRDIIETNDFSINNNKTRLSGLQSKQQVTGIIVNEKMNVDRKKYLKRLRAIENACNKYGIQNAVKIHFGLEAVSEENVLKFKSKVMGLLAYTRSIRENNGLIDPLTRILYNKFSIHFKTGKTLPINALEKSHNSLKERLSEIIKLRDAQAKGYAFEGFLNELFSLHHLNPTEPFRTSHGEQVDGAIELGDITYLVEAKYTREKSGMPEVRDFSGKLTIRPGVVYGLFISFSGYKKTVPYFVEHFKSSVLILLSKNDIEDVLNNKFSLKELIKKKQRILQERIAALG